MILVKLFDMYRLLFLLFVTGSLGQVTVSGRCDLNSQQTVQDFDLTRFLGTWYQIESIFDAQESGDCSTTTFAGDVSQISISNIEVVNRDAIYRNGILIKEDNADTSGTFSVKYSETQIYPYLVLATDYLGYALVYSCEQVNDLNKTVWAWKLGRNRSFTTDQIAEMNSILDNIPELQTVWKVIDQDVCQFGGGRRRGSGSGSSGGGSSGGGSSGGGSSGGGSSGGSGGGGGWGWGWGGGSGGHNNGGSNNNNNCDKDDEDCNMSNLHLSSPVLLFLTIVYLVINY